MNYAFAPEYRFPTQTIQLGEALQFLETNADRYGLDMSRVVLAGSSAGGQIVGSYANVRPTPTTHVRWASNPRWIEAL